MGVYPHKHKTMIITFYIEIVQINIPNTWTPEEIPSMITNKGAKEPFVNYHDCHYI